MRRSLVLSCLTILFASALGAAACTEAGGGRAVAGDAGDSGAHHDGGGDDASTDGDGDVTADGGDASLPVPMTIAKACEALATARCTRSDACTGGVASVVRYGSADACRARIAEGCVAVTALGSADAIGVVACADAVAAQTCTDLGAGVVPLACAAHGALAVSAACGSGAQCDSGFCKSASPAACGRCADAPRVDDPCVTASDCGSAGELNCAGGRCSARGAKGAICSAEDTCAPGLSCVTFDGATVGRCVDAANLHEPCGRTSSLGPACAAGLELFCSEASVCERASVETSGRLCGDIATFGRTECAAGGLCAPQDGGTSRCVTPVGEGKPCDLTVGPPCVAPAVCVANADGGAGSRCVRLDPATCK